MAKTNLEYLKETLNDEQLEWLEAVVSDHQAEVMNAMSVISERDLRIESLEGDLSQFENMSYNTIDFGIGKLEYLQPDNLRIQNFMDSLKERFHGHTLD